MKTAWFFLVTAAALADPLERKGSHYFIQEVFVEGQGPFRFLLDTGAETSAVSPRVAAVTGVRPLYRVEQVTATGGRLTPAGRASLRVGQSHTHHVEVLIGGFNIAADGVLGQSFLRRFDYLITRDAFLLDPPPLDGSKLDLREEDGRPVVTAFVNGSPRDMVLDSGSATVVLFGAPQQRGYQFISTNAGSAYGFRDKVRVSVGGVNRMLEAVTLAGAGAGLLPVAAFQSVHVSNRRSAVVLR